MRPVDGTVSQNPTTRGDSLLSGLPNSVILVYSLLGLGLTLLLLTLSLALLVLLRRASARGPRPGATQSSPTQGRGSQEAQEPNQHSKSSKGQFGHNSSLKHSSGHVFIKPLRVGVLIGDQDPASIYSYSLRSKRQK